MPSPGPGAQGTECPIGPIVGARQTQRERHRFYSVKVIRKGFLEEAVLERSLGSYVVFTGQAGASACPRQRAQGE